MSETQTASLTDFLLARFAEDEAAARQARPGLAWDELAFHDLAADDVPHIARHSPARVLAECEANRQLIRLLDLQEETTPTANVALEAKMWLALPYADHPDFRAEWAL